MSRTSFSSSILSFASPTHSILLSTVECPGKRWFHHYVDWDQRLASNIMHFLRIEIEFCPSNKYLSFVQTKACHKPYFRRRTNLWFETIEHSNILNFWATHSSWSLKQSFGLFPNNIYFLTDVVNIVIIIHSWLKNL